MNLLTVMKEAHLQKSIRNKAEHILSNSCSKTGFLKRSACSLFIYTTIYIAIQDEKYIDEKITMNKVQNILGLKNIDFLPILINLLKSEYIYSTDDIKSFISKYLKKYGYEYHTDFDDLIKIVEQNDLYPQETTIDIAIYILYFYFNTLMENKNENENIMSIFSGNNENILEKSMRIYAVM